MPRAPRQGPRPPPPTTTESAAHTGALHSYLPSPYPREKLDFLGTVDFTAQSAQSKRAATLFESAGAMTMCDTRDQFCSQARGLRPGRALIGLLIASLFLPQA